jgi:NitT/TauT family transport system permease protein
MSTVAPSTYEQLLHTRAGQEARSRELARSLAITAGRAVLFGVVLGGWAYVSGRLVDRQFISEPVGVLRAFWELIVSGRLWPNLLQTLAEVLGGYAIGAVLGIGLAVLVAFQQRVLRVLRPFLIAFYSIPKIALAPLIIMWFGLGVAPKIILATVFVFFVVFMSMVAGLYHVSPHLVNVVRVMGARRADVLWKVTLPSTVPYLMSGLRIGVPEALIGAVIGEFISANVGLGYLVNAAAAQFNTAVTLAAVVALLLIVAAMDVSLSVVERRLLRWRPADTGLLTTRG